jgi:hypothetical protein
VKSNRLPVIVLLACLPLIGTALSCTEDTRPAPTFALDDSNWPIAHRNPQNTDSNTNLTPPTGEGKISFGEMTRSLQFEFFNPITVITQRVDENTQYLWTSTLKYTAVFRSERGNPKLVQIAPQYDHGGWGRFHGAYAFVAECTNTADLRRQFYIVASKNQIWQFYFDESAQEIALLNTYDVPYRWWVVDADRNDHIVGTTLLPNGVIIASTTDGYLAAYEANDDCNLQVLHQTHNGSPREFYDSVLDSRKDTYLVGDAVMWQRIPFQGADYAFWNSGTVTKVDQTANTVTVDCRRCPAAGKALATGDVYLDVSISNSIASKADKNGNKIYVVNRYAQQQLDLAADNQLSMDWQTFYTQLPDAFYYGRLGSGAGSSPSITECNGRDVVVITDGATPMNLRVYDRLTGVEIASTPVTFGEEYDGNSTSEQSVAVMGCNFFVVQNWLLLDPSTNEPYDVNSPNNPNQCDTDFWCGLSEDSWWQHTCWTLDGARGRGTAMFALDSNDKLTEVWRNDTVSAGTNIPLISQLSDESKPTVFISGSNADSAGTDSLWSVVAMKDGDVAWYKHLAATPALNYLLNPAYAGMEIVEDGQLVVGSAYGVAKISEKSD